MWDSIINTDVTAYAHNAGQNRFDGRCELVVFGVRAKEKQVLAAEC